MGIGISREVTPGWPARGRLCRLHTFGFALISAAAMTSALAPSMAANAAPALHAAASLSDGFDAPPGEVSIIRDRWGMAHLYASREEDGYWGLGYASAEDRLLPVLFQFLAVRGELAARFGRAAIPTTPALNKSGEAALIADPVANDRAALRGRFLEDARRNFSRLSPQLQADTRSYIHGLQQYMAEHPERVPTWAPPLEPALPLAVMTMFLFAPSDDVCLDKLKSHGAPPTAETGPIKLSAPLRDAAASVLPSSDAWVLAGARTASGRVIFGADSHGPIEPAAGSLFYPWRMHAGKIDLFAMELVGTSVAMFGHTRHYAWGWTEAQRQTNECVRLVVHANDARVFDVDGHPKRLKVIPNRIGVRGEAPVTGEFEYLVEQGRWSAVVQRDAQAAYAVRFSYAGRAGFAAEANRNLVLAKSPEDLRPVFASLDLYPANLLAGGADGTLVYIRPGRLPRRGPEFDADRFVDGNRSATDWHGFHSLAELVQLWNPAQGYLVNDNVSPEALFTGERLLRSEDYPSYFTIQPGKTNTRQERQNETLARAHHATLADAAEITFDDTVPAATAWAHQAASLLTQRDEGVTDARASDAALLPIRDDLAAIAADLAAFDGRFAADSSGALYAALLLENVAADAAPELRLRLADHLRAGAALPLDERQVLRDSVLKIPTQLRQHCGTVLKNFGDVFRIGRGGVSAASGGINIHLGDGTPRTLNIASPHSNVYEKWGKTCERARLEGTRSPMVVSFEDPIQSFSMQVFGVSDDPASAHFSDQSLLASRRQLKSNYFDAASLREHMSSMARRRTVSSRAAP